MKDPAITTRFDEAVQFALDVHRYDYRKVTTIPYVSHLFAVCALVMEHGGDEDEAIAALLHDTLEDHPETVSGEELERRFGSRVAHIVHLCTDTPADYAGGLEPPWHERKAAYVERLGEEIYPECRVPLADKLHNLRTIVTDYRQTGDAVWDRFSAGKEDQLEYHRSLVRAFRTAGAPERLLAELEGLINALTGDDQ